jgi:hypothetical protein
VRFSVRPRGLIRPRVREFVRSSVRPVGPPSSTAARSRRHATSLPSPPTTTAPSTAGFAVLRASHPRPPVRCRSGPHRLCSHGLRPRAWSMPTPNHRREMETLWSRWSPARHCRRGGSRDRRLRARRSGRGRRTAPCRPTVPSPMARRAAAGPRSSRLGAVLRNWETATGALASQHHDKKSARARRTGSMRKLSGLGPSPASRQFNSGRTVSDCSPRLMQP